MSLVNRYYPKNPLHLYSFDVEDNQVNIVLINLIDAFVETIKVSYHEHVYELVLNSKEQVINLSFELTSRSAYLITPCIESAVIDGKTVEFFYDEFKYLLIPKSINNMRDEKYLYIQKMVKYNGCIKENVRCSTEQFEDYWHCTCGGLNFNCQSKCIKCGIEKETLFSTKIDNGEEEAISRKLLKANELVLWFLIIVFAFHFFIIDLMFKGNVIFDNLIAPTFEGVTNRLIATVIPFATTLGFIFSRKRYNEVLQYVFDGLRIASLLYINILMNVAFVHNSYLFLLFLLVTLIFIVYYGYILYLRINKKHHLIITPLIIASLIVGSVQAMVFSKKDLIVSKEGITINWNVNEEKIVIPEKINGKKVTKVRFAFSNDFSKIKEIELPRYLEGVMVGSILDFPNLQTIKVDEQNEHLRVDQGVLFKDETVLMVPTSVSKLVIDWENVQPKSFVDCSYLEEIVISNDVKSIDEYAFSGCSNIKSIEFEDQSTLEFVGQYAFKDCTSIKSISLPNSIKTIDCPILFGCTSLETIEIPFIGQYRYETMSYLNKNAFAYLLGPSSDYNKADNRISNLKKVIVNDQKFIENAAFYNCVAEEIVIDGITGALGMNSFYSCENLKTFNVCEGIQEIKEQCFYSCVSLEEVTLPSTLTKIEKNAFKNCDKLTKVNVSSELDITSLLNNIELEGNEKLIELLNSLS